MKKKLPPNEYQKTNRRLMIPKQKVTEKYILAQMQKTQSDTHNTECKLWSKSFNPEPKDVKGLA